MDQLKRFDGNPLHRHPKGMSVIHASCVAIEGVGILIRGPSGSGKSDLALRLIDDGAELVADDYCKVNIENNTLTVTAMDGMTGKIEVRGLGILPVAAVAQARLGIVVDLKPKDDIERLPDVSKVCIERVELPRIFIDADTVSAALKVRLALRQTHQNDAKDTDLK